MPGVDGKTQLFAELMIYNLELVAAGAIVVLMIIVGVWASLKAGRGDFDEPRD